MMQGGAASRRATDKDDTAPGLYPVARPTGVDKAAVAAFVLTAILSVFGVKFGPAAVPFRSVALLLTGMILGFGNPASFGRALRDTMPVLLVVAVVALLGIVSSLMARTPVPFIGRQLLEIHAQAIVGTIVVYALVLRVGVRPILITLIAIFTLDGIVSVLQGLGISPAWRVRTWLGSIVGDGPRSVNYYSKRERPLGLSFSPIHLSYHIVLALAAFMLLRLARGLEASRRLDWPLLGFAALTILFAVVSGNRSPLLGMAIFLPLYIGLRAPRMLPVAIPTILLLFVLALPVMSLLAEGGLRVASVDDGSAEGRGTLRAFGLFLIGERPLGYGLNFDSVRYWQDFFTRARYMPNAYSIQAYALHNFYLNVLLKYGVLILAVVPWILPRSRAHLVLWLGFVPYIVHIFYHNEGPMQGDYLLFFLIPVALWLAQRPEALADPAKARRRTWRRAFAPTGA